jgi:DNA polymerase-1
MSVKVSSPESYYLLHEGAKVHAVIEHNGVKVDEDYLRGAVRDSETKIAEGEAALKSTDAFKKWRRRFGEAANLDSRPQLAEILYGELGYVCPEKTAGGDRDSTDEAILCKIDDPFVKDYLKVSKHKKLLGTYLLGILKEMTPDGFVHPNYNLNTARSFRPSCNEPNWQNVPIRNPEVAAIIRRCYRSRHDRWHIVEVDFAQIEVRVAAAYTKDRNLIKYVVDPSTDMHRDTAGDLFHLSPAFLLKNKDWAKKLVRDWAKNRFVFPQFYGSVYFQCCPSLWDAVCGEGGNPPPKMPDGRTILEHLREKGVVERGDCTPRGDPQPGTFEEHVRKVERVMWDKRFPEYTEWKRRSWCEYQERGYFELYTGFVVDNIHKRNDVLNYPIQGSSFHLLLWSLIEIQREIRRRKMRSLLVGEIHDCLVADVPPDELEDFLELCRDVMTKRTPGRFPWLNVPLEVEAEVCPAGASWYDKKLVMPMTNAGASLNYDPSAKDGKGGWLWLTE